MSKDTNIIITTHDPLERRTFLHSVRRLRSQLENYMKNPDDSESKKTLESQLKSTLLMHSNIRNRGTKLLAEEIQAENMLKEMIGRGTQSQHMGKFGELVNSITKLIKFGSKRSHQEQIFDQLLARAKLNSLPAISQEIPNAQQQLLGPKKPIDSSTRSTANTRNISL